MDGDSVSRPSAGRRQGKRFRRRTRRAAARLTLPVKWLYARGVLSTGGLALPDFLLIGAQKGGTTWLAENLDAHPEISMARLPWGSDPTEVRYFDQQFHRSLRWYSRFFRDLPGRLRGDKSPNYCMLPAERVRLIGRLLPDARILVMLRNPVERAWSQALMNLVRLPRVPYEEVTEERFRTQFRAARERGDYATMLDTWRAAFPPERIFVGVYGDVAERPRELLGRVFDHLGAAPVEDWSGFPVERRINAGPGVPIPARLREFLAEMYRADVERLRERIDVPVDHWLEG